MFAFDRDNNLEFLLISHFAHHKEILMLDIQHRVGHLMFSELALMNRVEELGELVDITDNIRRFCDNGGVVLKEQALERRDPQEDWNGFAE
jgi:hypothetical protein